MRYLWPLGCLVITIAAAAASCGGDGQSTTEAGAGGSAGGTNTGGRGNHADSSSSGIDFDAGHHDGGCSTQTTCAEQHKDCGPISDGCGAIIQCGDCMAGTTCGGGGDPNVCGVPMCTPTDCATQGFNCGPAGDGCGHQLDCGTCMGTDTCGGGGVPGVCGTGMMCMPKSCGDLMIDCGPAGDGCGGQLMCGTCNAPDTCGGGGTPSVCGVPPCNPNTCGSLGIDCGPAGDGCGGVIQCGTCGLPNTCGGAGTPSVCGIPPTCTGLCLQQVSCPNGGTTSISGTVYAPNGTDPLPNVLVFVPNAAVQPFMPGVSCDNCAASVSGNPLVSAVTDTQGHFTITNAPVGNNIPLVIQTGRWRRQITVSSVASCTDTGVANGNARLPRSQMEGDIPHMAFVTGSVDVLECVLRKVGVVDTEFTNPGGGGRIHLYQGDSAVTIPPPQGGTYNIGGARINSSTPGEQILVGTLATLEQYDMVLFPCKGAEENEPGVNNGATPGRTAAELSNLVSYANAGGRVFATHFSYVWFDRKAPFSGTANWSINQAYPTPDPGTGYIDTSFPKGQLLADWLQYIGASTTNGQITINTLRRDLNGVVAPSTEWMALHGPHVTMHYTFNTPINAQPDQQCGRVLFDDFHVENHGYINQNSAYNMSFPAECTGGAMTPQEKLLEFMIFDLGSCVTPDIPMCTPTTCAALNIGCGPAGDGCGGLLDCGNCPMNQTCGGGGTPSQCGMPTCNPLSCLDQGIECGPAGDGCGNSLDCGSCPAGQTCGGGGTPGVCGSGMCTPQTCASQGIMCGPAGDGCGNGLACGPCPPGQTCGGGGMPGVCGNQCTPQTCAQLGFNCGQVGDGCGNIINCGMCALPQTCGGGGQANVCGGTQPH